MSSQRHARRAWLIWTFAVIVYLAAVFHRGSLGVAGTLASERFAIGPAALGVFTVLQVGVYAAMQIPTGLLVDRFGPRRVLTAAAVLLGVGQLLFAFVDSYPAALAARVTVGVGDALTWVSILRLVAAHFSARRYALVASVSSALGALGGVLATVPLGLALGQAGWTPTFAIAGVLTAAYAVIAVRFVRDTPPSTRPDEARTTPRGPAPGLREVLARVPKVWRVPGTRLAFWVHFSTMFLPGVLGLLWGFPYLVDGLGVAPGTASVLVGLLVFGGVFAGPLVGALIGHRPTCRIPLVLGYLLTAIGALTLLLSWPGDGPPLLVVAMAFVVFACGGPASSVAFALVRDYNDMAEVGTATGVANVGGHFATAFSALLIGVLLDVTAVDGVGSFRIAFLGVGALMVFGMTRTLVWWRRARAVVLAADARGESVPVRLRQQRWDLRPAAPVPAHA
ncbi:MFS transporter [Actinoalloteichus hymeniacidonis]|uniref:Sugar phosphate permease n=1 Tax=Actinoalloteichus hymeniacidonis TaxID=340345 RepID=A0AAC9HQD9_9PSEU|nr:MFS transporter [Actinoalloteichus hymeniacidonis]AOS62660.1 sugar phosphate permease [Actinoalloteichus hymeniacidonis]MBB5909309.1 MFS family permease [Actinoalloteichus hymeniacidonis]